MVNLTGQVALVTGGGRGIGRATAIALAEAGASVAVIARTQEQVLETAALIESRGGRARPMSADITDAEAVKAAVDQTCENLGPIDLLVNNAAVGTISGPIWETDPAEWWACLDVNLRGPFLCVRAVVPQMISRGRGRVVNVASGASLIPIKYFSAYAISKTALMRLTESLAREAAKSGVYAFSVNPGSANTAMANTILTSEEGKRWLPWFSTVFDKGEDFPPEAAAHLIRLLASGEADSLSGRMIGVSDDVQEMIQSAELIKQNSLYALRMRSLQSEELSKAKPDHE